MVCDGVALVAYATLGPVVADWIQRHCVIPDGPQMGDPFVLTDEMRSFVDNFTRSIWRPGSGVLLVAAS